MNAFRVEPVRAVDLNEVAAGRQFVQEHSVVSASKDAGPIERI
jgi:hypothetical protein